jgi:hypothetical protein
VPAESERNRLCVQAVFASIAAALPTIIICLLASFIFILPDQFLDIYRDIAQSIVAGPENTETAGLLGYITIWKELLLSLLALVGLSFSIWLTAHSFIHTLTLKDRPSCRASVCVQAFLPVILAVLPLGMITVGLILAQVTNATETKLAQFLETTYYQSLLAKGILIDVAKPYATDFAKKMRGYNNVLTYFAAGVVLTAVAITYVFVWLQSNLQRFYLIRSRKELFLRPTIIYTLIVALIIVGLSIGIATAPLTIASFLTPIPIFCLFCVCLLFSMDVIRRFSDMSGYPILIGVLLLAGLFSLAGLNDNHAVRYSSVAMAPPSKAAPLATDQFERWLLHRKDLDDFGEHGPYPIYLVAAEGGGSYAALHAATFLSDIQQMCPNFGQHLFAISSVSGGSVGVSVFNALMREAETQNSIESLKSGCRYAVKNDGPPFVEASIAVLNQDLWAPLEAALLFPDFLQRFLFWRVPSFDRARALEHALEQAWLDIPHQVVFFDAGSLSRNLMAAPYADHWDVEKYQSAPALLLNTTDVATGNRRVIAPFEFPGTGTLQFFPLTDQGVLQRTALPLSASAILSARFPWLTPAGWYRSMISGQTSATRTAVVDGGYFENSGVATALDLIKALDAHIRKKKFDRKLQVNLIILTSDGFTSSGLLGVGEALGPIQTMLNTRKARAAIEIARAKVELSAMSSDRVQYKPMEVKLSGLGYPLPLGWRLSTTTRYLIELQNGLRSRCESDPNLDSTGDISTDCIKKILFKQLSRPPTQ